MKFNKESKYLRWGITAFLVIVAAICFYYLLFHISTIKESISFLFNILMPIVIGLVLAYVLTPMLNFVEYKCLLPVCKKLKLRESAKRKSFIRGLGIFITLFLFCGIIYSLVYMMLSQIIPSVINIANNFTIYLNNFMKWLDGFFADYPDIADYLTRMLNRYSVEMEDKLNSILLTRSSELIKQISLSTIGIFQVALDVLVGLLISIYLLAGKEKFAGQAKKITYALFEKNTANIVINNFRFTNRTFVGFIVGKILDSLIIGMLCFVGTTLLKTPYAALISIIVGVTNIIPFFGPFIGAIPSIILIFVVDPMHPLNSLYFALFILALQQFDGNVLGPLILGDSTGIAGFWVIFSITLFGGLFGVLGMVVGVPIFAVLYAAIKSFVHTRLSKKSLSIDTKDYIALGAIDDAGYHEFKPDYQMSKAEREKNSYGKEYISSFNVKLEHPSKDVCDKNKTDTSNTEETTNDSGDEDNNQKIAPKNNPK